MNLFHIPVERTLVQLRDDARTGVAIGGAGDDLCIDLGSSITTAGRVRGPEGFTPFSWTTGATTSILRDADVLIDRDTRRVTAVGVEAGNARFRRSSTEIHLGSLKRLVENVTRSGAIRGPDSWLLSAQIADYLSLALAPHVSSATFDATARVFIAIPNSFPRVAQHVIVDGVRLMVGRLGPYPVDDRVVALREGEAAAHYVAAHLDVPWVRLLPGGAQRPEMLPKTGILRRSLRVACLDVGAGNSILAIANLSPAGVRIEASAGVPIAGAVVDAMIVEALVEDARALPQDERQLLLGRAAEWKTANALCEADLPFAPEGSAERLPRLHERVLDGFKPARDTYLVALERNVGRYIDASIRGLFRLIAGAEPLDAIILTGRGSALPAVRRSIVELAEAAGIAAFTLGEVVALKLAVLHGLVAASTRGVDPLAGERSFVGRRIVVRDALRNQVASLAPILGATLAPMRRIALPVLAVDRDYWIHEESIGLPADGVIDFDRLARSGLVRFVSRVHVPARKAAHVTLVFDAGRQRHLDLGRAPPAPSTEPTTDYVTDLPASFGLHLES